MTFKDAYWRAATWQRRVYLISQYHNARLAKNRKWKLTDSAHYFGVSMGLISESLTLMKKFDDVKIAKSRKKAMEMIK